MPSGTPAHARRSRLAASPGGEDTARALRAMPASRPISDLIRPASAAVRTTSSPLPSTARRSAAQDASISPARRTVSSGMHRRIPRPCEDSGAAGASACSGGSQAGRGAGHHGVLHSHLPTVKAPAAAGLWRQRSTSRRGAGRPGPVPSQTSRAVLSGAPAGGGTVGACRPGPPATGRPMAVDGLVAGRHCPQRREPALLCPLPHRSCGSKPSSWASSRCTRPYRRPAGLILTGPSLAASQTTP
jgi:hypothetical protein